VQRRARLKAHRLPKLQYVGRRSKKKETAQQRNKEGSAYNKKKTKHEGKTLGGSGYEASAFPLDERKTYSRKTAIKLLKENCYKAISDSDPDSLTVRIRIWSWISGESSSKTFG